MKYVNGNLILKYLTKQCSDNEKQDLDAWLNESSQNRQTYNYFEQMMLSQLVAE
jgi:hypothetical protein